MPRRLLLVFALAGCSGLDPQPLDPVRSEQEFRARRLDDPSLTSYLQSHGETPETWNLERLTLAAFYYHPDLDVARARLAGDRGGETTAGSWPNPTLNADLEKVMGNPGAGVSPWVYGFNLQMPLDFLWKRGYRVDEARARTVAGRFELAEVAWQVRRRLRTALLDEVLARREVELRQAELSLRSALSTTASRLLSVGEASRLEADRARAELAAARVALDEVQGRAAATRAVLASAIGVPVRALETVSVEWPGVDALPAVSIESLQQVGLLNRLDVRRGLAEYAAAEAALGLELVKRYPDVTLGPGYLFDQGDRKFTVGLSISLPIFNQNAGPIAEAEARRKEAAARFLAIQARAIGEFEEAAARYRANLRQLASLKDATDATARRLEGVRRAVELGEADRVTLLGLQLERAIVEFARFDALRRAQEALGALEDALQHPVGSEFHIPESSPRLEEKKK
jgi:outer membrane protein TolC